MLEENMSNFIPSLSGVLELPDYEKLIAQLSKRKWQMTSSGKKLLEPKKAMKKRCLSSADKATNLRSKGRHYRSSNKASR
jgi:phage terminase large subunit